MDELKSDDLVRLLAALPMFKGVSPKLLAASAPLWTLREYEPDTALWWHGEMASSFAVVLCGELMAHIAGEEVGRIPAGQLVGESAAFFRDRRTASVSTTCDTSLALMDRAQLVELRSQFTVLYDRLLDASLRTVALRVQDADRRIARLAEGSVAVKARKAETSVNKFFKRIRAPFQDKPPSVILSLRAAPVFYNEKDDVLSAIGASMKAHRVEPGEAIFHEGDPGDSVFVVADGCIQVVRNVGVGKGEPLADLFPGALFGTGSLLLGERRNASCLAPDTTASWVYEMDGKAHLALSGKPGRRWREALLSALWYQLNRADEQLVRLKRGGEKVEKTDYQLIRAGLVATKSTDEVRRPWELDQENPENA